MLAEPAVLSEPQPRIARAGKPLAMTRLDTGSGDSPLRSSNKDWLRALQRTADIHPAGARTLGAVVDDNARTHGDRPALIGPDSSLSYAGLARRSHQYARWVRAQGLRPGDVVALMLVNCEDYVAIWLGLTRVGVVVALMNTQLRDLGLKHCLDTVRARAIIAGVAHADVVRSAASGEVPLWVHGGDAPPLPRIDLAAAELSDGPLAPEERPPVALRDRALLIFTSGTTGLPKAAHVTHYRIRMWAEWFAGVMDARAEDRLYNCLPMYHSVGGVVAIGAMLAAGGSVVIRESFSASRFWADVVATEATIFQYIGELCRYLVNSPPRAEEGRHRLRLACGNGLGGQVWQRFAERFSIPQIVEFYAATEGSFSLFNLEGKPGAIGRIPRFMAHRSPVALVKFDVEAERPLRDADGRCIPCDRDEPGEAIGRIDTKAEGLAARFEGYTSAEESERKILRDVFTAGDAWFRTGDLMRQDREGFFYFVDRIGDTFRWKGENVATNEVADVLGTSPGVEAACVYGVRVPSAEGRAGMAALVTSPAFTLSAFQHHIAARLPAYARPLFLRILDDIAVTGTFKFKKAELARQGYEPGESGDVYVLDTTEYRPLDAQGRAAIASGDIRF